MKQHRAVCITAAPGELQEGLFGGIFVFLFEILPYLRRRGVFPSWSIASRLYGDDPDCVIVPGVLDLAYAPEPGVPVSVGLMEIRRRHNAALGSDWHALAALWSAYFRVPARVLALADQLGELGGTLGVHYRGGDKNKASWDSNPVSYDDFIAVVRDFLGRPHRFTRVFVATDEHAFVDRLREAIDMPVENLGEVRFHKELEGAAGRSAEADRAMLDCVVLSRCGAVLCTSSALSAFAKVLNPGLEIYRSAASKLYSDIPYFPIAYIPAYESADPGVRAVFARTMEGDWSGSEAGQRFRRGYAHRARRPYRTAVWRVLEAFRPLL